MSITPDQFNKNLDTALEETAQELEPVMEEAALNAKALLALRVQNKGFGRKYTSRAYVQLRKAKGYEIRFVNLTFSGRMFQGWRIPGRYREGLKVGGYVAGSDDETKNKLKWNKSRYPSFDSLKKEEVELIRESIIQPKIVEYLRKNLLKQ